MIDDGQLDSAWYLGREVAAVAPDDSTLRALSPGFARRRMLTTRPEGVDVSRASLTDTSRWTHIGTTPFDSVLLPTQLGMYRLIRPGYFPLYYVSTAYVLPVVLDSTGTPDPEMITIAGGDEYGTFLVGTDGSRPLVLRDWKIDQTRRRIASTRASSIGGVSRQYLVGGSRCVRTTATSAGPRRWRGSSTTGQPGPSPWEAGTILPAKTTAREGRELVRSRGLCEMGGRKACPRSSLDRPQAWSSRAASYRRQSGGDRPHRSGRPTG